MNELQSFLGNLVWSLPWREPLRLIHDPTRQSDLRLRLALERELQGRDELGRCDRSCA